MAYQEWEALGGAAETVLVPKQGLRLRNGF